MDQNNGMQSIFNLVRSYFFLAVMTVSTLVGSDAIDYQALLDELSAKNNKKAVDYYNMGVCAYHLNKPYESAVFWNYARVYADPQLAETIGNALQEARCCTIQFGSTGLFDFARSIPVFPVQLLALISVLVLIGVCIRSPRFILHAWIVFLIAFVGAVCIYFIHAKTQAVIADRTDLYVGPGQNYMKTLQLSQGATVAILEQHKSWCKIQSSNQKGWIEGHRLIRI